MGSRFLYNYEDGVTIRDYAQDGAKVALQTYWVILLSDADAKRTGVSEVKLLVDRKNVAKAYLVSPDMIYTAVPMKCE